MAALKTPLIVIAVLSTCGLIFSPLHKAAAQPSPVQARVPSVPPQIIRQSTVPTSESNTCPTQEQIQLALDDIRQTVDNFFLGGYECGGSLGWRLLAYLDTSSEQGDFECPGDLEKVLYDGGLTTCNRGDETTGLCKSAVFSANGTEYSRVCGRVVGYQYGETNAFFSYVSEEVTSIDSHYLDGVSLTHGGIGSREHIWSFAAARTEYAQTEEVGIEHLCPCEIAEEPNPLTPILTGGIVGSNYFCESGRNADYNIEEVGIVLFEDDPLWDGMSCVSSSSCCDFNSPPWFERELPSLTRDDVELRVCLGGGSKEVDLGLSLIELYVK